MELFSASRQWQSRPDDERFETLADLYAATKGYADTASTYQAPASELKAIDIAGNVCLSAPGHNRATLSNWAFAQLCARADAPATYLRGLPSELAAQLINHGLQVNGSDSLVMMHDSGRGDQIARSITGAGYCRIWNHEIISRLLQLPEEWRVAPARPARPGQRGIRLATAVDIIRGGEHGLGINVGDPIAPAGLYASDHDAFAFLVNEERRIDDGSPDGLCRGVFVWNSEVGAASFGICRFLYKSVCGNHIVWGASDVVEIRIRHTGTANSRAFEQVEGQMVAYANESASDEEAKIRQAKRFILGGTKDEVIDRVFGMRLSGFARKSMEAAYDVAEEFAGDYGAPNTAWSFANGVTHYSQTLPHADARLVLDRAAGRILTLATK